MTSTVEKPGTGEPAVAGKRAAKGETSMVPRAQPRTYYDEPVLKEPVWKWEIPSYFFTGGLAAGSALLAAGAAWRGDRDALRVLETTALGATAVSGVLLVADLGVPSRFHHMLRVAKPTSPMSVGSWALGAFAGAVGAATLTAWLGRGSPGVPARLAALLAGAIAPSIATYTAVLVADTAVPAWHDARHVLPLLFASGAAASAGGVALLLLPESASEPARRLALLGVAGELTGSWLVTRSLDPVVATAYEDGRAGTLSKVGRGLSGGGALVAGLAGRHRPWRRAGAALVVAGAVLERFAVVEAGRRSARDPHATVAPQRARLAGSG